ncbi:MAG: hypothetical protein DCC43_10960 [Candidatus Brocadia sp.]|uniref:Uncharacterized protein n=1 Tax=Candidatus Brocadia fulgida TaxID=380242 RepID=A0A0M2UUM7_9BACT|nr:MAG: hypothetical protein BROFUL_01985 [Candidatus Brocadia fulgida]MBV6519044.1 hypothetical protein [Candidatus Brocadia fulgida]MDG5995683.1 hypothetical protein [Candidatus Brocadia sp.]OQZ00071.1 MAG: hypothetical protein B6D35_07745 [Candidatus Brocadia sp. UTAMX2]RIJ96619.1 MAG: hypothetical protein DCC43_10960 [Candidatus Brocadia sp.]
MPMDKEFIKSKIHSKEDIALKTLTDIIAYKIYESLEDKGPEANFLAAAEAVAQYVSEQFKDFDSFKGHVSQLGKEMKTINQFADTVYNYYQDKQLLSFDIVKNMISSVKDFNLKVITDIVAYKIYQSPEDKDPELNFISAETFVAQYVSENFKNIREFRRCLSDLGKGPYALEAFADLVYRYYCQKKG